MKRKRLTWAAWALIFLGIGAFVGLAVGRGASRVSLFGRSADRVERIIVEDGVRSQAAEEIVIEVPRIPPVPTIPPIPTVPPFPSVRVAPYEVVVERDFPSTGIFSLIGGLVRMAGNLLALLLIVIGAVLILRQRNQPVEKAPPDTAVQPE
jgi:hypothetical protein